ncbi:MAG: ShlB/FhaC/HecB family hemolysin secretion/activation protein [Methylotenera sp.]|nr:ShlB/FhaC/HecB family hemolysin secretion/activation protein [Methylotenera sp.]
MSISVSKRKYNGFPEEKSILLFALLGMSGMAMAQPDAGTLLNQQQRQQQQKLPERLPETDLEQIRPALKSVPGEKVLIKSIRFTGATKLAPETELQEVVKDAIGKELDFSGLSQMVQKVTQHLHDRGWLLAEAYLPRQDVTEGVIEIVIREGRLDTKGGGYRVRQTGMLELLIDPERLKAIAVAAQPADEPLRKENLERAVLLMNDLPGITAKASMQPGKTPGTTSIVIDAKEGAMLTGGAWLDNNGNRDTGAIQYNVAAQANAPLRMGDQFTINYTHAEGLDLGMLGYSVSLGDRGLKLGGFVSRMEYDIIRGVGKDAGLNGTSTTSGLNVSYPFIRTRDTNLYGSVGYTNKKLIDDSTAGKIRDRELNQLGVTLSGNHFDTIGGGGMTGWNVGLTQGDVDLSDSPTDEQNDALAYRTQGSFNKLSFGVLRLQQLRNRLTFYGNLTGQYAGNNLDSSEKFILGGPNGVRAYPGSEGLGDSGVLANMELRYDIPGNAQWGDFQLVGFYDVGRINLHKESNGIPISTATNRNEYSLSGWGMGATLSKSGSHMLRLVWAQKIGDNPGRSVSGMDADDKNDRSRLWAQAMLWF